jgi:hypothetical protein
MKGTPTWKPSGLRAKRWRDAGYARAPANLLPPPKPAKEEVRWKPTRKTRPIQPEGPQSETAKTAPA